MGFANEDEVGMRQTTLKEFLDEKETTLDDLLDFYFPKGDGSRGKAMILIAQSKIEIDRIKKEMVELNNDYWEGRREGFENGKEFMLRRIEDMKDEAIIIGLRKVFLEKILEELRK